MYNKIISLPNGARFYKCDLHNHTPADNRFNCGNFSLDLDNEDNRNAFAKELVRYVKEERGIDVLGITEHNDITWLPYIQQVAQEVDLVVFPGVELGTLAGTTTIHFLALFNPDENPENISHWMSSLGLAPNDRYNPDNTPRAVRKNTLELTKAIVDESGAISGIAIAAHASSDFGLFQDIEGESRFRSYVDENLLAVEIPNTVADLNLFEKDLVEGRKDHYYNKRMACLNHSDGRCLEDREDLPAIGSKFTYIKMGSSPTVEALRQAFLDFESRIRLKDEINQERYPRLIGIAIEGGSSFLRDKDGETFLLHFNPNLNCFTGGRGSGKSALIQAIRFAFEIPSKTNSDNDSDALAIKTLGDGTRVTVFYETTDETCYRIERICGDSTTPKVFDQITNEQISGVHPRSLVHNDPIDVYGQKEIYEISKNPQYQLNLLDNYVEEELKPLLDKEDGILTNLRDNARDISSLQEEIDKDKDDVQELPGIKERLSRIKQQGGMERVENWTKVQREEKLLENAEQTVQKLISDIQTFGDEKAIKDDLIGDSSRDGLPNAELLEKVRTLLDQVQSEMRIGIDGARTEIQSIWKEYESLKSEWRKVYTEEQESYHKLQRDFPDPKSSDYTALEQRLHTLEDISDKIHEKVKNLEQLQENSKQMLGELQDIRYQAFNLRHTKAQELTNALPNKVTIDVVFQGHRKVFQDAIRENLSGSRLRQADLEKISEIKDKNDDYADPIGFVNAIFAEKEYADDTERENGLLATQYALSKAYCQRLAAIADKDLYELQLFAVPDLPVIKLRVGEKDKPLEDLSVGQKCTAILSLILVERNTPLVIDQPEDDLDNSYIFDEIVKTLRSEKERRQFVVATHNANIPVSGDAELIVVLDADEHHGWINCSGSIDEEELRTPVMNILDGGKDAFRIRKEKYGV